MITRSTRRAAAAVAALALVLAACGGDDDDTAGTDAPDAPAATEASAATDAPAEPSGDPVIIAGLTSLTGSFGPWGLQVQDGMKLAVADVNAAGGVDGRPLELMIVDDQSDPEEGASQLERIIEEGAVAVGGIISSGVAVPAAAIAEEEGVPLFLVKAGTPAALTAESRYTFRTCLPAAPMVPGPIIQYAEANGITKIGGIVADYPWGQAIKAAMEETFADSGVELQIEVAPLEEQDFTTYLRSLEGFGPELIVATGHPPGSSAITAQSADLGFEIPVTGAYTPFHLLAGGAGESATGRYSDFKCADFDSPEYADLATRYLEMSDQQRMDDDAVAGYAIVQSVAEAVNEVGADPAAVAEYLHANEFNPPGYAHPLSWTEWGELAEAAPLFYVLGAGPAPEGLNDMGAWFPELLNQTEPLTPFQP